jgi:hypothetical protein
MALVDVGVAALKASGNPSSKEEVVKAISKLRLTTTMGELDWTKGPVPNCVSTPITGIQWVKSWFNEASEFVGCSTRPPTIDAKPRTLEVLLSERASH